MITINELCLLKFGSPQYYVFWTKWTGHLRPTVGLTEVNSSHKLVQVSSRLLTFDYRSQIVETFFCLKVRRFWHTFVYLKVRRKQIG